MHLKVITAVMPSSSGVSRNPTIPLTKRDSLALNGSRVSLISNNSNNQNNCSAHAHNKTNDMSRNKSNHVETKTFKDSDYVNSHTGMVAGKKRAATKKVKRTDSYKLALKRQSAYDDIDADLRADKADVKDKRESESRAKYNTLPIKMGAIETNLKADSNKKKHKSEKPVSSSTDQFQRSASQKSGTFPSPDTDEDQNSTQPERKKKSTFKRMKERLIQTFRKDRKPEMKSRHRGAANHKGRHRAVSGGRIRPNDHDGSRGFQTPNSVEDNGVPMNVDEQNNNKGRKIIQSIRSSFRRKQQPDKSTDKQSAFHRSDPIDIPNSQTFDNHSGTGNKAIDGHQTEANDTISEIFGSLIDPASDLFTPPNCSRPDRSKLKLEGLTKFRPKSFERRDTTDGPIAYSRAHAHTTRQLDLSPTVEIDGLDYADAPIRASTFPEESDDTTLPYDVASQSEQQRRTDDVGRRLAAIGDRIVADKESESATSSSEAGPRRLSAFEEEIMKELRKFADTKNQEMSKEGGVSIYLAPIVKNILTAHTYPEFKQIVHRELANTMGWDQVAWYTYLMKTTMCVVVSGKDVGTMVKNNATRYFNSNLRPFIQSRRNGWDSIVEETDIDDSELD